MGSDLPFELDTIDAISAAKGATATFVSLTIRVVPFIIHLICAVLEFLAYTILHEKNSITCMTFFEISETVDLFTTLDYLCVLPDLMYAVLGPISVFMIYNNPYSVFFNTSVGLLNISNGALFHVRYSFCGNPEQGLIKIVPIYSYICGILHLINGVIAHVSFSYLDKEGELYCGRMQDFVQDMKK